MLTNKEYVFQEMKNIAMTYIGRYGNYKISHKNVLWKKSENSDWYTAIDEKNKRYYIYVQGSRDKKDWYDNLRVFPIFWPFVKKAKHIFKKFHFGHYQHAKRIFIQEIENIFRYTQKGYTICFRGHSLGGSVANILAIMNIYNVKDFDVITMGANKSISRKTKKLIEKYKDKFLQIRFKNDLVTYAVPFMKVLGKILQLGKRSRWRLIKNLFNIKKWRKEQDCDHNPKDYIVQFGRGLGKTSKLRQYPAFHGFPCMSALFPFEKEGKGRQRKE